MDLTVEKVVDNYRHYIQNQETIMKVAKVVEQVKTFSSIISQRVFADFNDELIKVYKVYKCKLCAHTTTLKRGEVDYSLKDKYGK